MMSNLSTVLKYSNYLLKAREHFSEHAIGMVEKNHIHHNYEPNFWDIMLKDLVSSETVSNFKDKNALEFGCGAGRNLVNMALLGQFRRVDGIDISKENASNSASYVKKMISEGAIESFCAEGNGYSCFPMPSNFYHFVMSDQVFIHIPNYEIRKLIILDIKRVLVSGGVFVVHFLSVGDSVQYYDNYNDFPMNVTVSSRNQLLTDFQSYGFSTVNVQETTNIYNNLPEWWVRCVK
jgi:SAM-dependent methyltransferase